VILRALLGFGEVWRRVVDAGASAALEAIDGEHAKIADELPDPEPEEAPMTEKLKEIALRIRAEADEVTRLAEEDGRCTVLGDAAALLLRVALRLEMAAK
jgi:hypothetical protein